MEGIKSRKVVTTPSPMMMTMTMMLFITVLLVTKSSAIRASASTSGLSPAVKPSISGPSLKNDKYYKNEACLDECLDDCLERYQCGERIYILHCFRVCDLECLYLSLTHSCHHQESSSITELFFFSCSVRLRVIKDKPHIIW